jgi:hypothetical protein
MATLAGSIAVAAAPVRAQDAATVQLQQDVLELKRVNQLLERRIESLEIQLSGQSGQSATRLATRPGANGAASADPLSLRWMNNAEWERIKPGMPEMEVIRILGVPNSLRDADPGRQVIFYALEIGTGRFLSGSVTLADHRVVEVQKPALK